MKNAAAAAVAAAALEEVEEEEAAAAASVERDATRHRKNAGRVVWDVREGI